jgi:hypothetical protein
MNEFSRRIAAPGLATLQDTERQMRPAAPAPAPQQPQEPQGVPVLTAFEDIARATGVPVNVLIADERINTAETAEQAVEIGRQAAEELRPHFAEGRGLTDALRAATGDDRRARQWADAALARGRELYPDRFPENSNAENIARAGGSAAIEGTGYVADYACRCRRADRLGRRRQRDLAASSRAAGAERPARHGRSSSRGGQSSPSGHGHGGA